MYFKAGLVFIEAYYRGLFRSGIFRKCVLFFDPSFSYLVGDIKSTLYVLIVAFDTPQGYIRKNN